MTEQQTETTTETTETSGQTGEQQPQATPEAAAGGEQPKAEAAPEGKTPEGEQKTDAQAKGENTEATAADLESIEFTPPEGMDAFKDQYAEFNGLAKEYFKENPRATAQEALKWAADKQAERVVEETQKWVESHNKRVTDWLNKAKADEEIGGDKFDENVATAIKVLDTWGSDDLKQQLDETGVGNHPDLLKMLVKAGKALESGDLPGPGGTGNRKSFVQAIGGAAK